MSFIATIRHCEIYEDRRCFTLSGPGDMTGSHIFHPDLFIKNSFPADLTDFEQSSPVRPSPAV